MKMVRIFILTATIVMGSVSASADFVGPYAPENWSFYTDANGTGELDATSMHLVGVDGVAFEDYQSNGNPPSEPFDRPGRGYTEYYITASATATVTFDWSFLTDDPSGDEYAFYALNFSEIVIADAGGQSGDVSVLVQDGDVLEIGVFTENSVGGPGELLVTNFQVPEPASLALMALGLLALRRR